MLSIASPNSKLLMVKKTTVRFDIHIEQHGVSTSKITVSPKLNTAPSSGEVKVISISPNSIGSSFMHDNIVVSMRKTINLFIVGDFVNIKLRRISPALCLAS